MIPLANGVADSPLGMMLDCQFYVLVCFLMGVLLPGMNYVGVSGHIYVQVTRDHWSGHTCYVSAFTVLLINSHGHS